MQNYPQTDSMVAHFTGKTNNTQMIKHGMHRLFFSYKGPNGVKTNVYIPPSPYIKSITR